MGFKIETLYVGMYLHMHTNIWQNVVCTISIFSATILRWKERYLQKSIDNDWNDKNNQQIKEITEQ